MTVSKTPEADSVTSNTSLPIVPLGSSRVGWLPQAGETLRLSDFLAQKYTSTSGIFTSFDFIADDQQESTGDLRSKARFLVSRHDSTTHLTYSM